MVTESFTSDTDWTVPPGVDTVDITCHGANGQDGVEGSSTASGGAGGKAIGTLSVAPGQMLYIRFHAGGKGIRDSEGGAPYVEGGDGGRGAAVHVGGTTQSDVVIMAGGGGGGGAAASSCGGANAQDAGNGGSDGTNGGNASASVYSVSASTSGGAAEAASGLTGLDGAHTAESHHAASGGGGGAGHTGGGGGGADLDLNSTYGDCAAAAAGGGGGGCYTGGVSNATHTQGGTGDGGGAVVLSYTLPVPSNLRTDYITDGGGKFSWDAPADGTPDYYELYRSTSSGVTTSDTLVATTSDGTSTTATDTSAAEETTYYYAAFGVYNGSYSDPTNEVSVTTKQAAPTDLQVTGYTDTTVSLAWNAPPLDSGESVAGYTIYYATASGRPVIADYAQAGTTDAGDTAFTVTGLEDAKDYFFRVTADVTESSTEETAPSGEVSQQTQPAHPTIGTVTVTNGDQLVVPWTDNATGEDGYRVYVRPTGTSSWTQDSGDLPVDTTSYTTSSLLDGEQYDVRVEAFTAATSSQDVASPAATTDLPDLPDSAITLLNGVEDEIEVDWSG